MDALTELLKVVNSFSPIGVAALLGLVLFYQVKNAKKSEDSFDVLASNHLHDLPMILETLQRMEVTNQRMEVANATAFSAILAKLNGAHK